MADSSEAEHAAEQPMKQEADDKEATDKAEDNDEDLGEERPTEVEEDAAAKDDGIPKQFKDLFMEKSEGSENETWSRNHPLFEFIRMQKDKIDQMTFEDFKSQFEEHLKHKTEETQADAKAAAGKKRHSRSDSADLTIRNLESEGYLDRIVLKFTTISEENETSSFTIGPQGGQIGRERSNDVFVPSDTKLAETGHAFIEYSNGSFYLRDGGFEFAAAVRISVGVNKRQWILDENAAFSAGNSVFRSCGINEEEHLVLEVTSGPLKGERRVITKTGATLGRSSDNSVSIPDRELSRRHSRVEYDPKDKRYYICDVGSTNGTYMLLVGPYGHRHKLSLNDHILVGRTGFSVNRFDYGLSEEMGHRQSMEDSCALVQHLNVPKLSRRGLAPQSFFGVFDGHGGPYASIYLAQYLHVNVAEALAEVAPDLLAIFNEQGEDKAAEGGEGAEGGEEGTETRRAKDRMDDIVEQALKRAFLKTDDDFITTSEHAQNGSTSTTALIIGQRLYCANVGDSRTILCRNFQAVPLSRDHKPTVEEEAKRIKDAGGFVINNRVMGELAVSRAFGDAEFKRGIQAIIEEEGGKLPTGQDGEEKNWDQPLVIAEPEVNATTITEDDQFLLLACDGLFDVYTSEDVVKIVKENLEAHGDPQRTCQELTRGAIYDRNSRDNVSVILIVLNKWY